MKIGIIGAGQIGGTLTRRLTRLGHEVSVANSRGPESLAALAKETRAKARSGDCDNSGSENPKPSPRPFCRGA
jgi:predicted dinucleotide-binding enzyme